jgi:hypothetical protein
MMMRVTGAAAVEGGVRTSSDDSVMMALSS